MKIYQRKFIVFLIYKVRKQLRSKVVNIDLLHRFLSPRTMFFKITDSRVKTVPLPTQNYSTGLA